MYRSVILALCVGLSPASFSQKKGSNPGKMCDCEQKNEFIRKRDFESGANVAEAYAQSRLLHASASPSCQAYRYHLLAEFAMDKSDLSLAKVYLDREKSLLDSLSCKRNLYYYREYFILLGGWYLRTGDFQRSIEQYNTALQILTKATNPNQRAQALIGLSAAYSRTGKLDKSAEFLLLAHPATYSLPENPEKAKRLYDLAARYFYRYRLTSEPALLDSASRVVDFARTLSIKLNVTSGYFQMYNLLEDRAYYNRNFRDALAYLDSARTFATGPNAVNERNGIFADMAEILLELKQYQKAYSAADSALFYAKLSNNPWEVTNSLELLYNCAKLSGEYERALVVYEDLAGMRDSVKQLQSRQAYGELEEKYHLVRKARSESEYAQEQELLRQQREIGKLRSNLILIGGIVVTLLLFYIFIVWRQRKIKSQQQDLEVEKRLERARINPDFLYSTLNDLQRVATSDPANNQLATKLALMKKLVKRALDSTHEDFLTLDKEVEFLTAYLDLQRDRTNRGFSYRIETDPEIDVRNVCIPSMILQPFLENTVDKGFKNLAYPGEVLITFKRSRENELYISIQDNGNGLKAGNSTRASEIISDRLFLLNKRNKDAASYLIRERISGGIIVEIFLPLITLDMAGSYQ